MSSICYFDEAVSEILTLSQSTFGNFYKGCLISGCKMMHTLLNTPRYNNEKILLHEVNGFLAVYFPSFAKSLPLLFISLFIYQIHIPLPLP